MQRRLFLGFGARVGLASCCPPRREPVGTTLQPLGLTPLAPAPRADGIMAHALDAHDHFFDATDVPVRGFAAGKVAYSMASSLRPLVKAAAPVLERLGNWLAPSCGEYRRRLRRLPGTDFGELLDRADVIVEHGFVGIKIYPPMGFGQDGSAPPATTGLPTPDPATIGEPLRGMLAWCAEQGVAVMGHADHTMGREPSHDDLSHPGAWEAALPPPDKPCTSTQGISAEGTKTGTTGEMALRN